MKELRTEVDQRRAADRALAEERARLEHELEAATAELENLRPLVDAAAEPKPASADDELAGARGRTAEVAQSLEETRAELAARVAELESARVLLEAERHRASELEQELEARTKAADELRLMLAVQSGELASNAPAPSARPRGGRRRIGRVAPARRRAAQLEPRRAAATSPPTARRNASPGRWTRTFTPASSGPRSSAPTASAEPPRHHLRAGRPDDRPAATLQGKSDPHGRTCRRPSSKWPEIIEICPRSELPPGHMRLVEWEDLEIGVFNCAGDDLRDRGPLLPRQRAARRGRRSTRRSCTIECPRHGSAFDLKTGKPLTLPAYVPVDTFPVILDDHMIKLEVD